MKLHRDVLWVTLYQIPPTHVDQLKNMDASGNVSLGASYEYPHVFLEIYLTPGL